jgi:hypothetical protein
LALSTGCASNIEALRATTLSALLPNRQVSQALLVPEFAYLRIVVNGRLAFLARGAIDRRGTQPLEVFFSADRETLKLLDGRIVEYSSSGRHIIVESETPPAPWTVESRSFALFRESRPEYVVSTHIVSRRLIVEPPKPSNLIGIAPASLTWFEEITEQSGFGNARSIYAIRRGTNGAEVVYSEQCIAPDLCFTVQLWDSTGPR